MLGGAAGLAGAAVGLAAVPLAADLEEGKTLSDIMGENYKGRRKAEAREERKGELRVSVGRKCKGEGRKRRRGGEERCSPPRRKEGRGR